MFRFGAKKNASTERPTKLAGLDVNASRARAVTLGEGRIQQLHLEGSHDELPFFLHLDGRATAFGHAALAKSRVFPHATCSGFLGQLGQSHEWRVGRTAFTPETATQLAFDKL